MAELKKFASKNFIKMSPDSDLTGFLSEIFRNNINERNRYFLDLFLSNTYDRYDLQHAGKSFFSKYKLLSCKNSDQDTIDVQWRAEKGN